jgi:hypothetical protein
MIKQTAPRPDQAPRAFAAWQKAQTARKTDLCWAEWYNAQVNKLIKAWQVKAA